AGGAFSADRPGKPSYGRRFVKRGQGQFDSEDFLDLGEHSNRERGVSAQIEEVLVNADGLHAEYLLPNLGELALRVILDLDDLQIHRTAYRESLAPSYAPHAYVAAIVQPPTQPYLSESQTGPHHYDKIKTEEQSYLSF